MSTNKGSGQVAQELGLTLVADPPPWYATAPTLALDRRALEDEHTRILSQGVGDHLPYELALRAAAVAEQLQRRA